MTITCAHGHGLFDEKYTTCLRCLVSKLEKELAEERNRVALYKAQAEGLASQLLDVQRECVALRQEIKP